MPASRCLATISGTARSSVSPSLPWSTSLPSMPPQISSTTSSGRGRLPAWVVTMWSVLRGMPATVSDRPAERQSVLYSHFSAHERLTHRVGGQLKSIRHVDVVRDFLIQRCFIYLDPD